MKLLAKLRYYWCRLFWYAQQDYIYCYYGSLGNQLDETKDHVNLFHVTPWNGDVIQDIQSAKAAGLPVMLTPPDINNIPILLQKLQELDLLSSVKYLYLVDEPNINPAPNIRAIKSQVKQFTEVKYAVIYSGNNDNYIDLEEYDLVGVDDYGSGADVLNTKVLDLRKRLNDGQKLILVPGGASPCKTDPSPFFDRAREDDKVAMVCAFAYFDPPTPTPEFTQGIRSNGMAKAYGLQIHTSE